MTNLITFRRDSSMPAKTTCLRNTPAGKKHECPTLSRRIIGRGVVLLPVLLGPLRSGRARPCCYRTLRTLGPRDMNQSGSRPLRDCANETRFEDIQQIHTTKGVTSLPTCTRPTVFECTTNTQTHKHTPAPTNKQPEISLCRFNEYRPVMPSLSHAWGFNAGKGENVAQL